MVHSAIAFRSFLTAKLTALNLTGYGAAKFLCFEQIVFCAQFTDQPKSPTHSLAQFRIENLADPQVCSALALGSTGSFPHVKIVPKRGETELAGDIDMLTFSPS
jgi:hypothetical protein